MVQWEGERQVGLSPGQTRGYVSGSVVERPATVSPSTVYDPGKAQIEVKVERDAQGRPIQFNLYRYDQYGNLVSIGTQRAIPGSSIITTPIGRATQEQIEKYSVYQQREYGFFPQTPGSAPAYRVPSAYESGYFRLEPGGLFATMQQQRQYPQQQREYSFPASRIGRTESEFYVHPRLGQMIPQDLIDRTGEGNIRELMPSGVTLSKESVGFYKGAKNISESIRDFSINTGWLPPEVRTSIGYNWTRSGFRMGKESAARLTEFVGTAPGTTEIFGRTALKSPQKLPGMVAYGGLAVVGGFAKQLETEPFQLASDIIVTAGIFKGAGKLKSSLYEPIKYMGKKYVPPETIIEPQVLSGKERFPLAPRGTTGGELVKEFMTSKYRLPGTEGKIGGWHATPEAFAKETVTQAGTSEGKGLYIAPSTSPHFWKLSSQFKLFGWDNPPGSPAGIWLETAEIRRSPVSNRFSIELQNMFLQQKAQKGVGYISAAFEKGIKPEKEAIIPPETPIMRVSNKFFTKFLGKRVPLMEYTAKQERLPPADYPFDFMGGEHGITVTRSGRGMVLVGGAAILGSKQAAAQKQETWGELTRRQLRISSEYSKYREPILTPSSIISSISRGSYRKPSMSSITSSYARSTISSLGGDAAGYRYSPLSYRPPPVKTSQIYSPGRPRYSSKIGSPGKPTYPGYPMTPTKPGYPGTALKKLMPRRSTASFFRKRRGMRSWFKYPEITGIAKPKQVLRGFRL